MIDEVLEALQTLDGDSAIRKAVSESDCAHRSRPGLKEHLVMNENPPRHVIDAFERRWTSRLSRQAHDWITDRAERPAARTVVDKKGRLVPVTFKNRPSRSGAEALYRRIG
jgi:hypothetical protein